MNEIENDEDLKKKIKDELKKKIKEELKKELMEEIYKELKSEEKEPTSTISESTETIDKSIIIEKPQVKTQVKVATRTILKISSHALKYANKKIPKTDWVEVIGLLAGKIEAGKIDKNTLIIEDAYPMGHGNAIHTEIKDYKNYARAYNDIKQNGMFICGWYHSHPTYGLFMSGEDIDTQSRYQRLWKKSVALVIDPYMIDGTSFGFEIFTCNLKKRKWSKIPFEMKDPINEQILPELLEFVNPIVDGRAIFLEYDEE
jgi:proteasome lid subunit RPN8/RPN11